MTAIVVINEQHSLTPQQEKLIKDKFHDFERYELPAGGATLDEADKMADDLGEAYFDKEKHIIIVSPFPALMAKLHALSVEYHVLHNDKRTALEVTNPDGTKKVIHQVSPDGWVIV